MNYCLSIDCSDVTAGDTIKAKKVLEMEKVIVVTGATDGIGLAVVKALVSEGYEVIGVARNRDKAERIETEIASSRLRFVFGDLSSLSEVKNLADQITVMVTESGFRLAALIHVAGVVATKRVLTVDGLERTFAVNHLAVHLLTRLLMPLLQREKGARVLVVSSMAHRWGRVHFHDVSLRHGYWLLPAYAQSKLMNVLFVRECARRYDAADVSFYAVDPGLVNTTIALKLTSGIARWIWKIKKKNGVPTPVPAGYIVRIATGADYAEKSGLYWKNGIAVRPSRRSGNAVDMLRLYELSERLSSSSYGHDTINV